MMMISEWTGAEKRIHSFLYARGMTTPPPICRSALRRAARRHRAVGRYRAVGRHWAARRDRADRIHPAPGLPTDACNWAPCRRPPQGRLPPTCPLLYCRLGWYGQAFSKPTDHRSRVTYAYMILKTEWPFLECALMCPFGMWSKRNVPFL